MTKLFQQVVGRVSQMPDAEQDALARLILAEIEADRQWNAAIARSPDKLGRLADEAWAEHEAGKSEPLDPEKL
ncbi:MAG TPA: hypothetical protein VD997_14895 [Phycisphaerales bacterium]|nr:hypothetical protein [Phycisphaerales bacterium]